MNCAPQPRMRYFLFILLLSGALTASDSTAPRKHELFTKLGLTRVKAPNTHHRKRLAVESRHHTRSDDSHMYVIKLPPNPHYYAHNEIPNSIPRKNIPVSFKSNGKPAKVYHWNIPVIKKIVNTKHKSRNSDSNEIDFQNEVFDKSEERKPVKATFYVPAKPKKASFMKYFPGNGKLHSFYVIESSKKAHYHRLLP
ncbi:uncharacterized protein LOC660248 isoform X1 [Tribolium castaneum]|uniref:uncharacterized protein LOC660248 isoform X1 n=1 Tax=Tribolium castaneum TaxID=7070 RepID=UPI00077DB570|nr:PREDICTED: uncharacterized protein LOC660248 isoform X1 [Tribolium castaneum]|eukprot:XP_015837923.1 PREDICTED: uncharacterized protein LOC660248 isoform X1 [Tribolium castaneum]